MSMSRRRLSHGRGRIWRICASPSCSRGYTEFRRKHRSTWPISSGRFPVSRTNRARWRISSPQLKPGGRLVISLDKCRRWFDYGSRQIRQYPVSPEESFSLLDRLWMPGGGAGRGLRCDGCPQATAGNDHQRKKKEIADFQRRCCESRRKSGTILYCGISPRKLSHSDYMRKPGGNIVIDCSRIARIKAQTS